MARLASIILILGGIACFVLTFGFWTQAPWAVQMWPWPDGPLTLTFIASIQAAIGAAMIYIGITQQWYNVVPGALNLFVMMAGVSAHFFILAQNPALLTPVEGVTPTDPARLQMIAIVCAVWAAINLVLFVWMQWASQRLSSAELDRAPIFMRVAYGIYVLALVLVGGALILKTPNVMPWPLKPETSVIIGWIFFGDAFYFLYGILRPYWQFSRAQLWSFLAYDAVLLYPFLSRIANGFTNVAPEFRSSLIVYTIVLIFSALVSIYYLFIRRRTRQPAPLPAHLRGVPPQYILSDRR
jgi:hypothetical protein